MKKGSVIDIFSQITCLINETRKGCFIKKEILGEKLLEIQNMITDTQKNSIEKLEDKIKEISLKAE